jgi:DNA-binding phage protein
MDADEIRRELREAGRRRTDALAARDAATARIAELAPAATAAGIPMTEVARLAGITRQAIYLALSERRPPTR